MVMVCYCRPLKSLRCFTHTHNTLLILNLFYMKKGCCFEHGFSPSPRRKQIQTVGALPCRTCLARVQQRRQQSSESLRQRCSAVEHIVSYSKSYCTHQIILCLHFHVGESGNQAEGDTSSFAWLLCSAGAS